MKAIVLAAGTGSRLGEITKTRTKGMVPVKGKRLIDYLMDFLGGNFFDEIIVVGGFCYEDLRDHLETRKVKGLRVVENKEYLKGNIFTLVRALEEFQDDSFLITNVDHIYPPIMFEKMKENFSGIKAMCDFDRILGDDDMKVKLDPGKSQIVGISKALDDFDCGYIGMTYVDKSYQGIYRKAVEKTIEEEGDGAVVENVLRLLARNGEKTPEICDLSGFGWYEVDTESDLMSAEKGVESDSNFEI